MMNDMFFLILHNLYFIFCNGSKTNSSLNFSICRFFGQTITNTVVKSCLWTKIMITMKFLIHPWCSLCIGSLMVITLKIISCVINYNDGVLKEEDLREAQKRNRLTKLPSLLEYFGYCLCCGSHFAGPVYEMKDYLDWTERKGVWVLYSYKCFNIYPYFWSCFWFSHYHMW